MVPHRSGHEAWLSDLWPLQRVTKRQQKKSLNTSCFNPCSDFVFTLGRPADTVTEFGCSAAACPNPSPPFIPLWLSHWRSRWRMGWGGWSRKKKKGQFVHFYKDMWRVRREIYRERRAGGRWESGKIVQQAGFIMTEEKKGEWRIWKDKKEERSGQWQLRPRAG